MFKLRYYCKWTGNIEIVKLLQEIKNKHNISYEIMDLSESEKEKQVYERDFRPRAKILKKRTGESITKLRGAGGKHRYYISNPGTIAVIKDYRVEWWTYTISEIFNFLNRVLSQGQGFLEELCTKEVS